MAALLVFTGPGVTAGGIPTTANPSISGEVTYSGSVTGTHMVYVWLAQRMDEPGPPVSYTARLGPGPYTLTNVAPGTYYVVGSLDANDSGTPDWGIDPIAAYNMGALVTVTSTDVTGINIALDDAPRGGVFGQVNPQGRTNKANVVIDLNGAPTTMSLADGSFCLVPPASTYVISAALAGYLQAQGSVVVAPYTTTTKSAITLPGGDATNDGVIDIYDLVAVGAAFGTSGGAADINGDAAVNIFDLVLAGANYGRAGPISWP